MTTLHVGLDLDNTMIDYDHVFGPVAVELGLLPEDCVDATKPEVRSRLRDGPGDSRAWMRLQGQVYGRYIGRARPIPDVDTFCKAVRARGVRLTIVSHKTEFGHEDPHRVALRDAALDWLESNGFFRPDRHGFTRDDVLFESTRSAKLARIGHLGCDLFIDDLPEVLRHPDFPARTTPLWYSRRQPVEAGQGLVAHRTWTELTDVVLEALSAVRGNG